MWTRPLTAGCRKPSPWGAVAASILFVAAMPTAMAQTTGQEPLSGDDPGAPSPPAAPTTPPPPRAEAAPAAPMAVPPGAPMVPPPAPPASKQIEAGHTGIAIGIPGFGPPAMPLLLPAGQELQETLIPSDGVVGFRLRASEAIFLRGTVGLGTYPDSEAGVSQVGLRLGLGVERHFGEGMLSPYVGPYAAAIVLSDESGPMGALEIGGMAGVEIFFTPRLSTTLEQRLTLALAQDAGGSIQSHSGGMTVNIYF